MWKQRCIAIARDLKLAAKLLERDPADLPADPVKLHLAARQAGIMDDAVLRRRWHVLRPALRAAIERCGLSKAPGRYHRSLNVVWNEALQSPPDPLSRAALSRFVFYLSIRGIRPNEVCHQHFNEFYKTLAAEGLVQQPNTVTRLACKAWNACSKDMDFAMPRVVVPSYDHATALPEDSFPFTLRMEIEAYLAFRSRDTPASALTPIRPITARALRFTLVFYASLLVRIGMKQNELDSLQVLTHPANVRAAIDALDTRFAGRPSKQATHITSAILTIARVWLHLPILIEDDLKSLCVAKAWRHQGIAKKNRALISQFDGGSNVKSLLGVPRRLVNLSLTEKSVLTAARMVRAALALEILLTTPIRLAELLALNIKSDISYSAEGATILRIVQHRYLSKRERHVKLGSSAVAILKVYFNKNRPCLVTEGNMNLFPGRRNGALGPGAMREDLCRWSACLANVEMTPTMFRHFAAKHYLADNPGDFNVVRGVLGHRSVKTTIRTYGQIEAAGAASLVDLTLFSGTGGSRAGDQSCTHRSPQTVIPPHSPAWHRRPRCRA